MGRTRNGKSIMPRNNRNDFLSPVQGRAIACLSAGFLALVMLGVALVAGPGRSAFATGEDASKPLVAQQPETANGVTAGTRAGVDESFGKLPLQFEPNRG